MPVTTLDAKTALVVIDLQKGILGLPTVHPSADILANAVRLANAFRARGLPVVLVTVEGGAPGRTQQSRPAMQRADDWADPTCQRPAKTHRVINGVDHPLCWGCERRSRRRA